jgi:hypothetical protein
MRWRQRHDAPLGLHAVVARAASPPPSQPVRPLALPSAVHVPASGLLGASQIRVSPVTRTAGDIMMLLVDNMLAATAMLMAMGMVVMDDGGVDGDDVDDDVHGDDDGDDDDDGDGDGSGGMMLTMMLTVMMMMMMGMVGAVSDKRGAICAVIKMIRNPINPGNCALAREFF